MGEKLQNKAMGFYFLAITAVIGIISVIRFAIWATAHNTMDYIIIVALVIGVVLNVILMVKDNNYIIILMTACYSVAGIKVLTDSAGSFVDAFQGISMFGDATQVGTIISISGVIGVGILLSIIASFLKRNK